MVRREDQRDEEHRGRGEHDRAAGRRVRVERDVEPHDAAGDRDERAQGIMRSRRSVSSRAVAGGVTMSARMRMFPTVCRLTTMVADTSSSRSEVEQEHRVAERTRHRGIEGDERELLEQREEDDR